MQGLETVDLVGDPLLHFVPRLMLDNGPKLACPCRR